MVEVRKADGHYLLAWRRSFQTRSPRALRTADSSSLAHRSKWALTEPNEWGALAPRLAPYLAPVNGLQVDESRWYDVLKRLENDTNQAS